MIILPNFCSISPCFIGFPMCQKGPAAETPKRSVSFIHIFIDQAPTRTVDKCWTIVIPKIENQLR